MNTLIYLSELQRYRTTFFRFKRIGVTNLRWTTTSVPCDQLVSDYLLMSFCGQSQERPIAFDFLILYFFIFLFSHALYTSNSFNDIFLSNRLNVLPPFYHHRANCRLHGRVFLQAPLCRELSCPTLEINSPSFNFERSAPQFFVYNTYSRERLFIIGHFCVWRRQRKFKNPANFPYIYDAIPFAVTNLSLTMVSVAKKSCPLCCAARKEPSNPESIRYGRVWRLPLRPDYLYVHK